MIPGLALTQHQLWSIEQAASVLGQTAEDFIAGSAVLRANYILANRNSIVLTFEETSAIADAIGADPGNNSKLQILFQEPDSFKTHGHDSPSILPIGPEGDVAAFDCGEPLLNQWLVRQAFASQSVGYSNTYVASISGDAAGYFSLGLENMALPRISGEGSNTTISYQKFLLLQRLAVDLKYQGRGLAKAMIKNALIRCAQAPEITEIQLLMVEARDQAAKQLYMRCGFSPVPTSPYLLFLNIEEIRRLLSTAPNHATH